MHLSTAYIRACLSGADSVQESEQANSKTAAVLIPLFIESGQWRILYTRRSVKVQDHKGEVSFPGGAKDPGDASIIQTALREANEEIGLLEDQVEVLGTLKGILSITDYWITPVVAKIDWPFEIYTSADEVDRVFSIPLDWLADPRNKEIRPYRRRRDGVVHSVIFFQEYDGELLWGLTASMTVRLLETLRI